MTSKTAGKTRETAHCGNQENGEKGRNGNSSNNGQRSRQDEKYTEKVHGHEGQYSGNFCQFSASLAPWAR